MKYFFMKFVVINFANPLYDSGFGKKENFIVTSKFYCKGDLILLIKPSCSCVTVCANLICVIFVSRCDPFQKNGSRRAATLRVAWRAPRRAAASRQQGLITLGNVILRKVRQVNCKNSVDSS